MTLKLIVNILLIDADILFFRRIEPMKLNPRDFLQNRLTRFGCYISTAASKSKATHLSSLYHCYNLQPIVQCGNNFYVIFLCILKFRWYIYGHMGSNTTLRSIFTCNKKYNKNDIEFNFGIEIRLKFIYVRAASEKRRGNDLDSLNWINRTK